MYVNELEHPLKRVAATDDLRMGVMNFKFIDDDIHASAWCPNSNSIVYAVFNSHRDDYQPVVAIDRLYFNGDPINLIIADTTDSEVFSKILEDRLITATDTEGFDRDEDGFIIMRVRRGLMIDENGGVIKYSGSNLERIEVTIDPVSAKANPQSFEYVRALLANLELDYPMEIMYCSERDLPRVRSAARDTLPVFNRIVKMAKESGINVDIGTVSSTLHAYYLMTELDTQDIVNAMYRTRFSIYEE